MLQLALRCTEWYQSYNIVVHYVSYKSLHTPEQKVFSTWTLDLGTPITIGDDGSTMPEVAALAQLSHFGDGATPLQRFFCMYT